MWSGNRPAFLAIHRVLEHLVHQDLDRAVAREQEGLPPDGHVLPCLSACLRWRLTASAHRIGCLIAKELTAGVDGAVAIAVQQAASGLMLSMPARVPSASWLNRRGEAPEKPTTSKPPLPVQYKNKHR